MVYIRRQQWAREFRSFKFCGRGMSRITSGGSRQRRVFIFPDRDRAEGEQEHFCDGVGGKGNEAMPPWMLPFALALARDGWRLLWTVTHAFVTLTSKSDKSLVMCTS